jgi:GNAT superfamily N-acetyltransferase
MGFHLKVLVPAEMAVIAELIALSVLELQQEYTEAQRAAAVKTVFTVDSRLVADGTYFGAVTEEGRVVGCGGWSARKTLFGGDHQVHHDHHHGEDGWLDPAADAAKIRAIFVHPDYARQGIGGMLLKAAEDAARAAGFKRFEMGSTLTGVKLYAREGYREIERIQVPVGDGETIEVVRMGKDA